jgi:hypothetical protein
MKAPSAPLRVAAATTADFPGDQLNINIVFQRDGEILTIGSIRSPEEDILVKPTEFSILPDKKKEVSATLLTKYLRPIFFLLGATTKGHCWLPA